MARTTHTRKPKPHTQSKTIDNTGATELGKPVFSQPEPTEDPKEFEIKHPSDGAAYKQIDALNKEHKIAPLPFPAPRNLPEPTLSLAAALGADAGTLQKKLTANGQIVFHATGD